MEKLENNNIVLVYTSLVHYRKSLFELFLDEKKYNFYILSGKKDPVPNLETFESFNNKTISLKNINLRINKNTFTYQFPVLLKLLLIKPRVIILFGVNPLFVSNLFIFFLAKLFSKTKILWWGHGTLGHQGNLGERFRLFFYNRSDGIFLYDNNAKKHLLERVKNIPIHVVGNTLNTEDFGFNLNPDILEEKIQNTNQKIHLLFSGRLTKRKKVKYLIEALYKLNKRKRKYSLTIIGDGAEKENLEKLAYKLGVIKDIAFTGKVYGNDVYDIFIQADIYVLPAHAGLSLVHANSYGIPVITSENPDRHPPEFTFLRKGINGDVFEDDNIDSLVIRIKAWTDYLMKNKLIAAENCINEAKKHTPIVMKEKFDSVLMKFVQ